MAALWSDCLHLERSDILMPWVTTGGRHKIIGRHVQVAALGKTRHIRSPFRGRGAAGMEMGSRIGKERERERAEEGDDGSVTLLALLLSCLPLSLSSIMVLSRDF